jgi:superfamily II RNA helicase
LKGKIAAELADYPLFLTECIFDNAFDELLSSELGSALTLFLCRAPYTAEKSEVHKRIFDHFNRIEKIEGRLHISPEVIPSNAYARCTYAFLEDETLAAVDEYIALGNFVRCMTDLLDLVRKLQLGLTTLGDTTIVSKLQTIENKITANAFTSSLYVE